MRKQDKYTNSEDGFVLITSLLILLVLTVLGIAVNRNTTIEWQIAMNDRYHKEAFYNADAATELASEVLEQNISCLNGFSHRRLDGANGKDAYLNNLQIWNKYSESASIPSEDPSANPDDYSDRDLVYPAVTISEDQIDDAKTNERPHANINIGGDTKINAGAAIMIASGYWGGAGKGLAMNGAVLLYDIHVQQIGHENSQSNISIQYGHVLGTEGDCNYN